MSDVLTQVIARILERHEASEEELLDALWCGRYLHLGRAEPPVDQDEEKRGAENGEEDREKPDATTGDAPDPDLPSPAGEAHPPQGGSTDGGADSEESDEGGEEEPQLPLLEIFGDSHQEPGEHDAGGLKPVHLPGASPFEEWQEALARAIRPLRLSRESRLGALDEARTVDQLAACGYVRPCWSEEKSTPFVITLVAEDSRSTAFWTAWIAEWSRLLRAGSRARVDCWHLRREEGGFVLAARPGDPGLPPRILARANPRRQILLFSDLVAPWWKSGHLPDVLQTWARVHPVTIVTPSPPRVWARTAVASSRQGMARVPYQRRARWDEWDTEDEAGLPLARPDGAPVFLLRMQPDAVRNWSRTVIGQAAAGHLALELPSAQAGTPVPEQSAPPPMEAALKLPELEKRLERVGRKGLLSASAIDLLQAMAAAPLTPGIMRLVQRALYPGQSHETLAEVVYSRLLARQGPQAELKQPDRVRYDFYALEGGDEGGWLRERLLRQRRSEQLERIQQVVGNYLAEQAGLDLHAIEALVLSDGGGGTQSLPEGLEPFAKVLGQVWQHLGGRRGEMGRTILQRIRRPSEVREPEDSSHLESDNRPSDLQNSAGMTMLGIPSNSFMMGSPDEEEGRESESWMGRETRHEVTLREPFRIAQVPVTQMQWREVMGSSLRDLEKRKDYGKVTGEGDDHPVYFVNWEDALHFCDALTERDRASGRITEDEAYTLPTEAQWEYSCRAGTQGPYNLDGAQLGDLGWHDANSEASTHEVGQKKPNQWGLQDTHGNVWEWCADWYREDLGPAAASDPDGPEQGAYRVVRGGSWCDSARNCRSACRLRFDPADRLDDVGFRPVLTNSSEREKLGDLEAEAKPEPEEETAGNERSPEFVAVPAAGQTFLMGSPEDEEGREPWAGKETQHEVTLSEDFEMAETPVTQAQWEAVMGQNPSQFTESGPSAPVEQVSWEEAAEYCAKLTAEDEDGWSYTLPTEAQWEFACRAGSAGPYNVEGAELDDLGWHRSNSGGKTRPVKEKGPNALGLYDLHGNVWEWCADWFQEDLGTQTVTDPSGGESGDYRVVRGGSWGNSAQSCRSACRHWFDPAGRDGNVGFRPVRTKIETKGAEREPEPTEEAEAMAGARSREDRDRDFTSSSGARMLRIPLGEFTMGSPLEEEGRESESWMGKETRHPVGLTEPFWMAQAPVTQGAWRELMGTTVAEQKEKGDAYGETTGTGREDPMYFVNWSEALHYCDALTRADRKAGRIAKNLAYSLPSEAQWEYACRAGKLGPFAGEPLDELGWYADNSESSTQPVGQKRKNPWGLQDMHGNVWEWCSDWFHEDLGAEAATDPAGPDNGAYRVVRGGSWVDSAQYCRSACRYRFDPASRNVDVGFRPVLTTVKQRAKLGELTADLEAEAKPEPEDQTGGAPRSGPAGMTFVGLSAGKFLMGSPEDEEGREPLGKETVHEVTLTQGFEIADTPVTQAQWKAVMGKNPSHFTKFFGRSANLPVEQVNWEEAVDFCAKLTAQDPDWHYRLPTEAQWEYACRAGTAGPFNVAGAVPGEVAWYDPNSGGKTHPVKQKEPNRWDLYDMHGNVWEWCADCYQGDLGSEPLTDPQGPESGVIRVVRGGSWDDSAQYCRSACRGRCDPAFRYDYVGFRPVRNKKRDQ